MYNQQSASSILAGAPLEWHPRLQYPPATSCLWVWGDKHMHLHTLFASLDLPPEQP
jgi:hypothetical protein